MMSVSRNITKRKQAEQALKQAHDELERRVAEIRLNEARLEAVLQLNRMTEATLQEITDFALEQAVALTRSKIGYLAFMNEDETFSPCTPGRRKQWLNVLCQISRSFILSKRRGCGARPSAKETNRHQRLRCPKSVEKGLPDGHVRLCRHMNVPILDGGHVVIVAGVGNKAEDYDESDVRQLTLLMEGMWTLIQRQRVQAELQRHRDHWNNSSRNERRPCDKATMSFVSSTTGWWMASRHGHRDTAVYAGECVDLPDARLLGDGIAVHVG